MMTLALIFPLMLLCFFNHLRVKRYMGHHGSSCFSHRRQNIITFRQLVFATHILISLHMLDMILLVLVHEPVSPLGSQESYRNLMRIYFSLKTFGLTGLLPLSWFASIWKNFPDFWSSENIFTLPPEGISDFGYFDQKPVPRGPYSYEKGLKELHNPVKLNPVNASASKFVYIRRTCIQSSFQPVAVSSSSEASPANPLSMKSSPSTLFYSRALTATATDIARPQNDKIETRNVMYVREFQEVQENQEDQNVQDVLLDIAQQSSSKAQIPRANMVKYSVGISTQSLACSLANPNWRPRSDFIKLYGPWILSNSTSYLYKNHLTKWQGIMGLIMNMWTC